MLDYAGLSAVAAVVREGSFEKAAQALSVTPSAVSQRVKLLEERIGAVLIVRAQPCRATAQGELICRHVEQVRMLKGGLAQRLPSLGATTQTYDRPTLPIAVNADSLATWFMAAAGSFSTHTGYLLKLFTDDQEHTTHWLKTGRVVGAVTVHGRPVQGCKIVSLGRMRYRAAASPAFVARYFPDGVDAAALSQAPALLFGRKDRLQAQWIERVLGVSIPFPAHWIPSTQSFIEAGLAGIGWGLSPVQLLQPHFDSGALVELAPGRAIDVPLCWQIRGVTAAQLDGLTDCIIAAARASLHGAG